MNAKAIKEIELNGLKPNQIEQIKAIIADFKRQNQREDNYHQAEEKSEKSKVSIAHPTDLRKSD